MADQTFPSRVDLRVGEEKSFVCPNVGVSGYVWQAAVDREEGVISAVVRRQPLVSNTPLPVGAANPQVLIIHALKRGKASVSVTLARPWEKSVRPRQSYTISVQVS